jgi:predicted kinase
MLAVIVNGLPGSGKTTLAPRLANALELPLFSKDAMKETIADALGPVPADKRALGVWNRRLGAATMELIWTMLGQSPVGAVIETPLLRDARHFVVAGLTRAGVPHRNAHEVWCDVPPSLARARCVARIPERHRMHQDSAEALAERFRAWTRVAQPLALGPVYRIDTTVPVPDDVVFALAAQITAVTATVA